MLLLDAAWRIDRVIRPERAVELLVTDRVIPASSEIAAVFHSPSITVEVPAVVAAVRGAAIPYRAVACTHRHVRIRDGHVCQFTVDGVACDRRGDSVDHLVPRSKGGGSDWANLVTSCRPHNGMKADRMFDEMRAHHQWGLRRTPFAPTRTQLLVSRFGTSLPGWEPFIQTHDR